MKFGGIPGSKVKEEGHTPEDDLLEGYGRT